MNDFDAHSDGQIDGQLSGAIGARASAAPVGRPEFSAVLADRQSRTRRRTAVAAAGLVVVGITGIAAFAAGGGNNSTTTADGPVPSNGDRFDATTTALGVPYEGTAVGETIWYCEGAIDRFSVFPTTTTIAPATTLSSGSAGPPPEPDAYIAPMEDSGYFRDCHLVQADGVPIATYVDQFPTTTTIEDQPVITNEIGAVVAPATQSYVVQTGDYAIKIADMFGVPLQELLDLNGWSSGNEFPFPGNEILIPPGAISNAPVTTTRPDG